MDVNKIIGIIDNHDGDAVDLAKSIGGALELRRAKTAKKRAGGQELPPSKYMPDVPRAVHAEGGEVYEPHKRAEEQGYSIKGYHVTRGRHANAISSAGRFDPDMSMSPGERAVFFWDNPEAANEWTHHTVGVDPDSHEEYSERENDRMDRFAPTIMPVRIHHGKHLEVNWPEETGQHYYDNRSMAKVIRQARADGYDTVRIKNMIEGGITNDEDIENGYKPHDQIAVLNPAMIRSEFAEFDPEKKGRDDIGAAHGGAIDHMAAGGFEDEPAPVMGHNNPPPEDIGGLSFSPEESNARLTTRLNRIQKAASGRNVAGDPMNERTVVRAPEGSNLPDFVAGKLTFDDWKNRHQALSNADEMKEYASWYQKILGEFQKYYPDENEARSKMRAWLVAQQNVSPAGAMNNVLLQNEQIRRGVPEEEMKAAGMPNPTMAARAVLKGDPIRGGVGQKIADFVDAAEGKNVRSWMNNDERGGSPFVVDVHTARDTGMVDQELINHLTRLGYNSEDLAKLRIDLTGTPTEAAYENRGDWGRALTQHLNETNWMGRNDWTPSEVQAIGWMGMTKLTRNAEEDSESGLARNYRRISYEIAPGEQSPWEAKYGAALNALPEHEKYNITKTVSEHAMDLASQLAGIDTHNLVHGTGAWEKYQNPASVGQALSTKNAADIAAHALGYLLNQTEVWHNTVKKMTSAPKGFAIDFIENGSRNLSDKNQLQDFWQTIMDADETGLIKGYQPITLPTGEVGIRALVDKGGVKTKEALEKALKEGGSLDKALKNLPFDVTSQGYEAEISKARNDWSKDKNGEAYLERLGDLLGRDPSATLNSARASVESVLEQALDEAHKRNGTSWRETRGKKRGGSVGSIDISHALEIARRAGNNGDTILAHINPQEAALLKRMGGSGTINPKTGLPQFGVDGGPERGSTGSAAGNSYSGSGGSMAEARAADRESVSGYSGGSGGGGGGGGGGPSYGGGRDNGNDRLDRFMESTGRLSGGAEPMSPLTGTPLGIRSQSQQHMLDQFGIQGQPEKGLMPPTTEIGSQYINSLLTSPPPMGTSNFGDQPMQSGFPSLAPTISATEARQGDVPGMSQEELDWNRKMEVMQRQNQSLGIADSTNDATNQFLSAMREIPAKLQEAQPLYAASKLPLVGGMIARSYGLQELSPAESAKLYSRIYSEPKTIAQNLDWSFGQRSGSVGSMPSGTTQYNPNMTEHTPSRPVSQTPSTAYSQPKDFGSAFASARAAGKDTFSWTNPKTGQTGLYTTKLKAKGGSVGDDPESILMRALAVAFRYGS